jgi:DNA polymerase III gamma/tau subunit
MKQIRVPTIVFVMVCTALFASSALGQKPPATDSSVGQAKPASEPLNKKRLLKLLTLNDSTQPELIQIVGQKGVDFQPNPADERELHDAGASDDLIVAVRANCRNGATTAGGNTNAAQSNSQPAADQALTRTANSSSPTPKKKGFLSKLNQKMDEATAKLNKANAEANKQAQTVQATTAQANQTVQSVKTQATQTAQAIKTQTTQTAQSLKGNGSANVSTVQPTGPETAQPQTAMSAPESNTVANQPGPSSATTSAASPETTSAPENLAGTRWATLSITGKGEAEKVSGSPPDMQFCNDGSWAQLHYGGSMQGGKYQMQGAGLVMKTGDGKLFGDFKITRNGNEMTLDDGKYVLRLKYLGVVRC